MGDVRVSRDRYDAHIEPAVAVSLANPDVLLVACRVFMGVRMGIATYGSADAGRTWYGGAVLPGLISEVAGNATVVFDRHGHGYVGAVVAASGLPRRGDVLVWRTDDGGRSFHSPVTAIAGGMGLADHPRLAVDPLVDGAGAESGVRLYASAAVVKDGQMALAFTRSDDGGRTFSRPRLFDPAPGVRIRAPVLAAAPGGVVGIVYLEAAGGGSLLRAVTSIDRGATFATGADLTWIAALAPALKRVSAKSGPALAADPGSGDVHVVVTRWNKLAHRSQILLITRCHHRGWQAPRTVASSVRAVFLQPQIAISSNGRIAVGVYAARRGASRVDMMLYLTAPGSAIRFAPPRRINAEPFDAAAAINTGRTRWLGNYQGLAASRNAFHPVWTDTRTGAAQIYTSTVIA